MKSNDWMDYTKCRYHLTEQERNILNSANKVSDSEVNEAYAYHRRVSIELIRTDKQCCYLQMKQSKCRVLQSST